MQQRPRSASVGSRYVPVRMNAYVPDTVQPAVFYVPDNRTEYGKGEITASEIQNLRSSSVKERREDSPQRVVMPSAQRQEEIVEWSRFHRKKPVWMSENRRDYPIKVFAVSDRWVTEQKDSYSYYVNNTNETHTEDGIQQNETNDDLSRERKYEEVTYVPKVPKLATSNLPKSISSELNTPRSVSGKSPTTTHFVANSSNAYDGNQQRGFESANPQVSQYTPRIPKPEVPIEKEKNEDVQKNRSGSTSNTPRSSRAQKSSRNIVDTSYVHVPLSNLQKDEEEKSDPIEDDPNKKSQQLKQHEKFRETRKKIKKQQKKNDQLRNKYIDDYYRQQSDAKMNTLLTDSQNFDRYLPYEGRPPFHNYGWANQNPVTEENRMKSHNINPRDVHDVYPNVISRRERSSTYEGWKRFLETTIGYKQYRPASFYKRDVVRDPSRNKNRSSDALRKALSGVNDPIPEAVPVQGKKKFMREVPSLPIKVNEFTASETKQEVETPAAVSYEGRISPPNVGTKPVTNERLKIRPDEEPDYQKSVTRDTPIYNQHLSQSQINPSHVYIPTDESHIRSSRYLEHPLDQGSQSKVPDFKQRRNSIGALPQFSRIDSQCNESTGKRYVFAPNRNEGTYEMFVGMHNQPELHPIPIVEHEELNPRYYKNLPPSFTNFIRPAGKPTAQSITTADCFDYFD